MKSNSFSIYIGVGSNIQPERNVLKAFKLLQKKVKIINTSTFYKTKAISKEPQPDYLNGVWEIATNENPNNLKIHILRQIENQLKRQRNTDKYSSRTIDLDILLYKDHIIKNDNITIPDPYIYTRSFVAYPLYELNPNLTIPDTGKTISSIIKSMKKKELVPELIITDKLKKELKHKYKKSTDYLTC